MEDSSGNPVFDGDVLEIIGPYEATEDGRSFIYKGREVSVSAALSWHKNQQRADEMFSEWVKKCSAWGLDELAEFLDAPDGLLDWRTCSVDWATAFEMSADATVKGRENPVEDVTRRIRFDDDLGLDNVRDPWAYPPKLFMVEEAGGFDSEIPSDVEVYVGDGPLPAHTSHQAIESRFKGKHARKRDDTAIAARLRRDFRDRPDVDVKTRLLRAVSRQYIDGSVDAMGLYREFKGGIAEWARFSIERRPQRLGVRSIEDLDMRFITSRVAMQCYVDCDDDIARTVARNAYNEVPAPQHLDRVRMDLLRQGTTFYPGA